MAPASGRQLELPVGTAACDLAETSYNGHMVSPDQADREEQLADVQEGTEQRMHSAANVLPTANWCMSPPTSSGHARSTTDVEPNDFGSVVPQMMPAGSHPNVAVHS
jgi:hypothetical protein